MNVMDGSNDELQDLTNRLTDTWNGRQLRKEQGLDPKHNNISAAVSMNGQKLEEVTSFK